MAARRSRSGGAGASRTSAAALDEARLAGPRRRLLRAQADLRLGAAGGGRLRTASCRIALVRRPGAGRASASADLPADGCWTPPSCDRGARAVDLAGGGARRGRGRRAWRRVAAADADRRCPPGIGAASRPERMRRGAAARMGGPAHVRERPRPPRRMASAARPRPQPRAPRVVAVLAVVAALGPQVRGERERVARLGVAAQQLQGAAQAEQGVVVGRRVLDDGARTPGRLAVALRAEQRPAERLADRGLVGLEVAGARERDGRGVEVALLEESRAAFWKSS